ncbi:MAG: sigma factor-like helix-turn-helix DNA-binding protein [bacterium]
MNSDFPDNNELIDDFYDYLIDVIELLPDRRRKIFSLRYALLDGKSYTLREIGEIFGVSGERIRQIINKVSEKIRSKAIMQEKKNEFDKEDYRFFDFLNNYIQPNSEKDILKVSMLALNVYDIPADTFIKLVTDICYSEDVRKDKFDDSYNLYKKIRDKKQKKEKENRNKKQAFKNIFSQVIWPNNITEVDESFYKKISPMRNVNAYGEGDSGVFISNKINREVKYESQLELNFIDKLEKFEEVTWFIEQPLAIKYNENNDYYPDFLVVINGCYPVIVEVKPRNKMVLKRNIIKYQALSDYCNKHGYGYLIIDNNQSLHYFITDDINESYKNEIISLINRKGYISWKEYKQIRKKHKPKTSDFISTVIKYRLSLTLSPYRIKKGNYYLSEKFLNKINNVHR